MTIKIFCDGADIAEMQQAAKNPLVKGFTTNPTLMRKAGVRNYRSFASRVLNSFPDLPISFEVFADDFDQMEIQAREISSWGSNVYVKIPVCNTKGSSSIPLITRCVKDGIKVNVTAILCYSQTDEILDALSNAGDVPAIVSIFAGRIADTGRNPIGVINHALKRRKSILHEILWASPRQALDVYTADSLGCDIITVSPEIVKKLSLEGKNLLEYSVETVKMFFTDAKQAGYSL